MREEIGKWRENLGLEYFIKPDTDPLKKAIEMANDVEDESLAELDKALLVLSNYHAYLGSQFGIIGARVGYLQDELDYQVGARSAGYNAGSAVERRAIVVSRDENLNELRKSLDKEKTKLTMLKPILDSVKVKIDSIKKVYDRRIRNVS